MNFVPIFEHSSYQVFPVDRDIHRWQVLFLANFFFQHSHWTFVTNLSERFTRLFINLAMCIRALSPTLQPLSWFCRTSIVEDAIFHNELLQVPQGNPILPGPSRHSTTGTFTPGTSGSRCISLILLHERIRRRIRLYHFPRFSYRGGNCNCLI